MDGLAAVFWDIGGVILTNGWDHVARQAAAERFDLDRDDFEERHDRALPAFESGELSLEAYLEQTVFHRRRSFTLRDFEAFVYSRSQAHPDALALLRRTAAASGLLLAALNNESHALNEYRIHHFGLDACFSLFLSSCYLGARKPDEEIYRRALGVVRRAPGECLFIDDREENLTAPRALGMRTIRYENAGQLEEELRKAGVRLDAS